MKNCIYISAAHKSSGKTIVSLGLSRILSNLNQDIQTFKKGPDYIDMGWLSLASRKSSYNLDFNTQTKKEIKSIEWNTNKTMAILFGAVLVFIFVKTPNLDLINYSEISSNSISIIEPNLVENINEKDISQASRFHIWTAAIEMIKNKPFFPINHLEGRFIPLFIIDAEFDKLTMQMEAINLLQKVCRRDNLCPHHKQIPGHNHYSMMYHFNTLDDSIATDILYFMKKYIQ